MSSPERELPPLRVKILGDNTSFKKAHDEAISMAKGMEEHIKKVTRGAGGVGADKETVRRIKGMNKAYANQVKQDDAAIAATKRKARADRQAHVDRLRALGSELRQRSKNELADVRDTQRRQRAADRWERAETRAIALADRARQRAHARETARLVREAQAHRRVAMARISSSWQRMVGRGRNASAGFNNGLSNRADIYMHIAAIKQIASIWREPLQKLTEYQKQIATLTPTMGSKAAAKSFVDQQQRSTLGMIYGDSVSTAAARFQPLTKDQKKTEDMLSMVGDLAMGDAAKYKGISKVLADVMGQGYLQGDELEQFAEHEIPLTTILAKKLGVSTAQVREYGEQRRLSSALIIASLKEETAVGGTYAGSMNEIGKTLGIAAQRAYNLYSILQRSVMETVEKELTAAVNVLSAYIQQTLDWVAANKEATAEYVRMAKEIATFAVALSLAGFAVAFIAWNLRTLRALLVVLVPLQWAWSVITGLCSAAMFLWNLAAAGWLGTMAAVALVIVGLPLAIGAVVLAIHNLRKGFSLASWDLKGFAEKAEGFFWNIGHNSKILTDYVKDNFDALTKYLTDVLSGMFTALPNNLMAALRVGSELISVWADSQGKMMQFYMGAAIDKTVGDRFRTPAMVKAHDMEIAAAERKMRDKQNKDLGEHYTKLMEKESKSLKTGMEGVAYTGKPIEGLKFDKAELLKGLPDPASPVKEADGEDFKKLLLDGKAKAGGNKGSPSTAPVYQSGDHARQIYLNTQAMQARAAGTTKKEDKMDKTNKILKSIERNTKPNQGAPAFVPAGLDGVTE